MERQFVQIKGRRVRMFKKESGKYFCLNDIVRTEQEGFSKPFEIIKAYIKNISNLFFLIRWEKLNNENFTKEVGSLRHFKKKNKTHFFSLKKIIDETNTIGIIYKSGRYGGLFAHTFITDHFIEWIESEYKGLL